MELDGTFPPNPVTDEKKLTAYVPAFSVAKVKSTQIVSLTAICPVVDGVN